MNKLTRAPVLAVAALFVVAGCGVETNGLRSTDGGPEAPRDAARDGRVRDAGPDGGGLDGGDDAGTGDAGLEDATVPDAGRMDGGETDAGTMDAGRTDGGPRDGGRFDAFGFDGGACTPEGARRCVGDAIVECIAGRDAVVDVCPLGCTAVASSARCRHVTATHVTDRTLLLLGTAPLSAGAGARILVDTDTGRITNTSTGFEIRAAGTGGDASGILFRIQRQGGPWPDLAIFAVSGLTVAAGAELRAQGARSLVLLSLGPVQIDGLIDVGAVNAVRGPGGGSGGAPDGGASVAPGGGTGGGVGGVGEVLESAGGGGGHAAVGGTGGFDRIIGTVAGGAGGAAIADMDATPLCGGGGGGGGRGAGGGAGGGGGGALQITSDVSVIVSATGIVRAPGAGGREGSRSGGGGGAGGAILLEAPGVTVAGVVAANGGGGGGADTSLTSDGGDGVRGRDDTTPAGGGSGAGIGAASGGAGGAGSSLAGADGGGGAGGGGGGGAAGRLRFVTRSGGLALGGTTSPTGASARTIGAITSF